MEFYVNGQGYTAWEEVPPELRDQLRQSFPDADGNGVPDVFERSPDMEVTSTHVEQTFEIDGVTYDSVDDLPPKVRQMLEAQGLLATSAPPPSTAPAAGAVPTDHAPAQVMLNGQVVDSGAARGVVPKKWWQFWK